MPPTPHPSKDDQSVSEVDETTALLTVSKAGPNLPANEGAILGETRPDGAGPEDEEDKPLPRTQIFLLCYARIVEPIAFFSIFPFINKMIWETGGLNEADVGFYSGLIVSSSSDSRYTRVFNYGWCLCSYTTRRLIRNTCVGISLLIDPDAAHDLVGPCSGSSGKEAGLGVLAGRRVGRDSTVRPQ